MHLLLPEGILLLTAFLVLIFDFIKIIPDRKPLLQISLLGLTLSLLSLFYPWLAQSALAGSFFSGFYLIDPFSQFFKILFLASGIAVVLMNYEFFGIAVKRNEGEFYFLLLSSILGLMLAVSSSNLLMIYLALELIGQTSYLLAGWQKNLMRSGEASIKYFLFGAVSSAVLLYGISLFYGLTGTIELGKVMSINPAAPLPFLALLLMILGFGFKIAMFPMQFWCPDVYEGAPTSITAYLSVAPKAAGFAILLRFVSFLRLDLFLLFAVFAALTMTWGNFSALRQKNVKRMLAYSSIAQAGYILIGLVSPALGYSAAVFYLLAYAFANLGAFAIVIYLSNILESEEIESYAGFARRSPALAAAFTVFLLSLIGIPPLAGFMGKLLLFKAAIGAGFLWLAVLAVVNSVVSVYYYLNIVRRMYFVDGETAAVKIPAFISLVVLICFAATFLLGIFPGLANYLFLSLI